MALMDYERLANLGEQTMNQPQLDDDVGVARALAQLTLRPDTNIIHESVAASVARLASAFISLQAAAARMTAMNRDLQGIRNMLQERVDYLSRTGEATAGTLLHVARVRDTYADEVCCLRRAIDRYRKGGLRTKKDVESHVADADAYARRRTVIVDAQVQAQAQCHPDLDEGCCGGEGCDAR